MERKMTIEEECIYREDYQMRMLQANHIEGLLPVKGRGANASSYYDYDVSGKVSLKALHERNAITAEDIRSFLKSLLSVIDEVERHLLDVHCLLLQPEYIYYEEYTYYFCYYPPGGANLWQSFHTLTEYFVKQADYQDQTCVQMIFVLHKKTMEENYSLEKLARECLQEKKEEKEARMDQEQIEDKEYEQPERDWATQQELGGSILRETESRWTPVKRFLKRRKKPKWGDWDGLYIEEEEL